MASTRTPVRTTLGRLLTGGAFLLVYLALVLPTELDQVSPGALLRIPLEALVAAVLVAVLPDRPRRVAAALGGALLGLLTVLRVVDMGFRTILARPFDPVFDWTAVGAAVTFLRDSVGPVGAGAAAVAAALAALALVAALTLAALRLAGLVARHRQIGARVVPVLGVTWAVCFALGAQLVSPVPVASWGTAALAYRTGAQVPVTLGNHQEFVAQAGTDAFADTPDADLLAGLAGKDVVLAFVESYGRSALVNPEMAGVVEPVLADGTRRLAEAGFAARSGYLTSSTAGGGSWLAHATLLSGLWVTNQHDYDSLVSGDRLTLTGAFDRAGWRTVGVMPGITTAWPEGDFYGLDQVYDTHDLGYEGTSFTGFYTPDQYTLSTFQRLEYGRPDRGPLMAEIPLTSSHWPWAPLPEYVEDWDALDAGHVYDHMADGQEPLDAVWSDPARVRAAYAQAIDYSLTSLISWTEEYGDDDLVLVVLGDHQPAPVVAGDDGGRDVPITVVAKDPAVLDRIADWGWTDGLNPGAAAPVWRMDAFRDRFLTAFGSDPGVLSAGPALPPSPPLAAHPF
jgi:hypothetical protein